MPSTVTYNTNISYNQWDETYGGLYDFFMMPYCLNSLAGTLVNNLPTLSITAAANVYAGTTGKPLVRALNIKAGTTGLALGGVLNNLAGTTGLTPVAALNRLVRP